MISDKKATKDAVFVNLKGIKKLQIMIITTSNIEVIILYLVRK